MGLFGWLWPGAGRASETPQTAELIARVLRLSPTLKLARRYRARLAPALQVSFDYVAGLVGRVPAAREASALSWSTDPYIHAFFAAPGEVAPALSRSPELHAWFDLHPLAQHGYAVLGMAMTERRVFGVEQQGDAVRVDVARTTLSFDDHQVRVCGETEVELRREIVQRVVEQIALEGLARIGDDESRRDALEEERALLRTRLQLLAHQGAGTSGMLGGHAAAPTADVAGVARLQARLDRNAQALARLGLKTDALERELDVICDVLSHPEAHTQVETRRVRLDRMNVVVDDDSRDCAPIEFPLARIPASPLGVRAFSLVRFERADLTVSTGVFDAAGGLAI
ncbi:hypothetical protein CY652_00060 [Burkholderia sp. WAC0059]|uniref:hypothetical protein n=1 Tax=Burkholderia sp. WAC0059 TaxID=2066022 RepID=UPI000C7EAE17|nr:hypothetical protein [Burkholderia sp. WAC0059]PLZ04123.1 hypothetical protein CY652_00060 [Burkholderia sp. WAC0059]